MDPVSLIEGVVRVAQEIYALVKLAEENQQNLRALADRVKSIVVVVEGLRKLPRERQEMYVDSLEKLATCLDEIKQFASDCSRASFFSRLVYGRANQAKMVSFEARIQVIDPDLNRGMLAHLVVNADGDREIQLASLSGEELYSLGNTAEKQGQNAQAFDFYERAYRKGYVKAVTQIGKCRLYGIGVEESYTEAERHFRVGVDNNHAEAMFYLGVMFEKGTAAAGVNPQEALSWYQKSIAITPGHVRCRKHLDRLLTEMSAKELCLRDGMFAGAAGAAPQVLVQAHRVGHAP